MRKIIFSFHWQSCLCVPREDRIFIFFQNMLFDSILTMLLSLDKHSYQPNLALKMEISYVKKKNQILVSKLTFAIMKSCWLCVSFGYFLITVTTMLGRNKLREKRLILTQFCSITWEELGRAVSIMVERMSVEKSEPETRLQTSTSCQ